MSKNGFLRKPTKCWGNPTGTNQYEHQLHNVTSAPKLSENPLHDDRGLDKPDLRENFPQGNDKEKEPI